MKYASLGGNGGPPMTDPGDISMPYAPWNVRDFLQGVQGMRMDEVGVYAIMLAMMYDRMGDLKDDDRRNAIGMGCDIRMYRRIKATLLELGKIRKVDDRLTNGRVDREIADYCQKVRNKREAALRREAQKRENSLPNAQLSPSYSLAKPQLGPSHSIANGQLTLTESEKLNNINGCSATTVAQADHNCGDNKNKNKNKKEREEAPLPPKGAVPLDALWAFEAYNQVALENGLQQASKMTPKRQASILARLTEFERSGWERALSELRRSEFLKGKNGRNWRADLDWLIGPENFAKLHDGRYTPASTPNGAAATPSYMWR